MKTKLFLFIAMCLSVFTANAANPTIVSLTGGSTAGGWNVDINMDTVDNETWTLSNIAIAAYTPGNGVKFRAENAWTVNWGSVSWPNGVGTQGGANIQPLTGGLWNITFNSTTGAYSFTAGDPVPVVKLVGSCIAPDMEREMGFNAGNVFKITTVLVAGTAQFKVDTDTAGGTGFPMGTASSATVFINVPTPGEYKVSIDLNNGGTYDFVFVPPAPQFPSVAVVGNGAGGWPLNVAGEIDPRVMSTTDGITYKLFNNVVTPNQVKFRANNSWTLNWGATVWPAGTSILGSNDSITVPAAGNYRATFNRTTGEYLFDYPTIALVGDALPADGGWSVPVNAYPFATTDGETYTRSNLVLTSALCKFKADNDWTLPNTGANAANTSNWPSAAVGGGDNISAVAGTWNVTYTRSTGAYTFVNALATNNFTARTFKVSSNPSSTNWEIVAGNNEITSVLIVDVLGKVVYANNNAASKVVVDASGLNNGIYFAKVASANATETIKLVKN